MPSVNPLQADSISRNGAIDYLRFAGAVGIVFFHCGTKMLSQVGYSFLQVFVAILILYTCKAAVTTSYDDFIGIRARRLIVPWLAWGVFYFMLIFLNSMLEGHPPELEPWMLLAGPAIHLWFLPYAFMVTVATFVIASHLPPASSSTGFLLACSIFAGMAFAGIYLESRFWLPNPFKQWVFVLPGLGLGLALHAAQGRLPRYVALAALGLAVYAMVRHLDLRSGPQQFIIATLVSILALAANSPSTGLSRRLGEIALGVYLIHPFIMAVLLRSISIPREGFSFAFLVVLVSSACIVVLRSTRLRPLA